MAVIPITISGMKGQNFNDPTIIADNEWADTQNCRQYSNGLWGNRKGVKTFSNDVGSDDKVNSIHYWEDGGVSNRFLIVGSGTVLYSYAEGTDYNNGTFTSRQTGFTADEKFDFAQYNDTLLASNGAESGYSTTNNTTWTQRTGGDSKTGDILLFANDTGFITGNSANPSILYYGSTTPANMWDFASSLKIEQENGQDIKGLAALGPIIIVFKERSIYSVNIATPSREQLDSGYGCIAPRSIVKAENNIYFASEDGIYTLEQREGLTSSYAATPVSFPVQAFWDTLTTKNAIAGIYFPKTKCIYFSCQTSEQRYVLVYNIQFKSWSYYIGVNLEDWTLYTKSDDSQVLLYGDAFDDKVRELEHENRDDDEAGIHAILTTKKFDFGTNGLKDIQFLDIAGYMTENSVITADVFFDDETVPSFSHDVDSDNLPSPSDVEAGALGVSELGVGGLSGAVQAADDLRMQFFLARIPLNRTFRTVQLKLSSSGAGERWQFRSATFFVDAEAAHLFETTLIA